MDGQSWDVMSKTDMCNIDEDAVDLSSVVTFVVGQMGGTDNRVALVGLAAAAAS